VPSRPLPSEATIRRIDAFMKNGGTVIFDTRDAMTELVLGRIDAGGLAGFEGGAARQHLGQAGEAGPAVEPGEPAGIDPAKDELAFYPLIYWPIVPSRPLPSEHEGVDPADRRLARQRPARHDRPVDQGIEGELVLGPR
jgi:hypothetical protein